MIGCAAETIPAPVREVPQGTNVPATSWASNASKLERSIMNSDPIEMTTEASFFEVAEQASSERDVANGLQNDDAFVSASASATLPSPSTSASPDLIVIDDKAGQIKYSPGRPEWVTKFLADPLGPRVVHSGPKLRDGECGLALDQQIAKEVARHIENRVGSAWAAQTVTFDPETLRSVLAPDDQIYKETVQTRVGDFRQWHVKLDFNPQFERMVDEKWVRVQAAGRLGQTGLISGVVLALITTMFSYLRADHRTEGKKTRRLQFGAVLTILSIAALGGYFARLIPWF